MVSLVQKLQEVKELYKKGLPLTEARRFVNELRDPENPKLHLSLDSVANTTDNADFFINKIAEEPHISRLSLERRLLFSRENFIDEFSKNLGKTNVSCLELIHIPASQYEKIDFSKIKELTIDEEAKPFSSLAAYTFLKTATNITKLSLNPHWLYNEDLPVLKNGLPPNLKDFSLSAVETYGPRIGDVTGALPEGLETLNLNGMRFEQASDITALQKSVGTLKSLSFKDCTFQDPAMQAYALAYLLENTPVEQLTIAGTETNLSEQHINSMMDVFERHSSMIVKLDFPGIRLSKKTKERINKLEETRQKMTGKVSYNHSETKPEKSNEETAASRSPEEERKFTLFKEASANGDINKVYDELAKENKTLTAEDYRQKNAEGYRLIDALAYSKQLNKVFAPQHWNNAKDMQTVFDMLSDIHKAQLDGKDGRPNFKVLKNQVMAAAVRQKISAAKDGSR